MWAKTSHVLTPRPSAAIDPSICQDAEMNGVNRAPNTEFRRKTKLNEAHEVLTQKSMQLPKDRSVACWTAGQFPITFASSILEDYTNRAYDRRYSRSISKYTRPVALPGKQLKKFRRRNRRGSLHGKCHWRRDPHCIHLATAACKEPH